MNATLTTSSVQGDPTGTPFDIDDLELSSHRANQQYAGLYAIFDSNANFPTIGVEETIRVTLSGEANSLRVTVFFLQDTPSSAQVNSSNTGSSSSGSVSLSLSTSSDNAIDLGVCGTYSADVNGGGDDTQISYYDGDAGDASVYVWTEDGTDTSNTVEPGTATVAWAGCAASIEGTAASSTDDLLANDVESDSEVSAPALGQVHALTANDVESASEVSTPSAAEGEHSLSADDVESASEVSAPALGQIHALTASDVESASEVSTPTAGSAVIYDTFGGSGGLDSDLWATYEDGDTSSELTITQTGGKYNAAHGSSSDAITTWFNGERGRVDYFVLNGDFDVILRGAGIGTTGTSNDYQFSGLFCGLEQPDDYEFMVNGIRGGSSVIQERKSTVSDNSSQSEHTGGFISGGFSDMRVVRSGSTVTWYTQAPGTSPDSWTEVTSSYTSLGRVSFGTSDVWIGLITYGYLAIASFTGTVDQVEVPVGTPSVPGTDSLTADDVQSTSEVSAPSLGQVHAITADDVESASEVSAPALSVAAEALLADDVESASEVTSPSIGQVHALLARSIESRSEVSVTGINGVYAAEPSTGGRSSPRKKAKRRYVVEVDGELIQVASPQEAQHVLEQVRELARQSAERDVNTEVVPKPPRVSIKTSSGKPTTSKAIQAEVKKTQKVINREYVRAANAIAQQREISDLLIKKFKQEEEEELIALLL